VTGGILVRGEREGVTGSDEAGSEKKREKTMGKGGRRI